ncbi:MAG: tRNA uridine-5-carboxymethylaminomethyl(34) synthesis GTPase MnmE [Pseudomonadota bacterium]|nr:tRNA uridine-5-carboxymethylaminomethyl(34) synthesis GTPase MnmE [Pseudomonadota bacterium]
MQDIIVARATPAGQGGVSIIRLSGAELSNIATELIGSLPAPRVAKYVKFKDAQNQTIDSGLAIFFPTPKSFTGEDVLEIHCHGSPIICDLLIERICSIGARIAEPGEFSQRAFLNDKIDLTQAEAVADLIGSTTATAARAASRSLQGSFSRTVNELNDSVTKLRVNVEAAIDFPEEEIDFLKDQLLIDRLEQVSEEFSRVKNTIKQGCLLRDGAQVVIVGKPNVGKSSLLNAMVGKDVAIVTDIIGTTRDLVREDFEIKGVPIRIIDTAGLRETIDPVEKEGIRRANEALAAADYALIVLDADTANPEEQTQFLEALPDNLRYSFIWNKIDLIEKPPPKDKNNFLISALNGTGIEELRDHLVSQLGYEEDDGAIIARRRHLESLKTAHQHFLEARRLLFEDSAGELMAEELLQVQNALADITGQFSSDDLLGEIFSSFCIGK